MQRQSAAVPAPLPVRLRWHLVHDKKDPRWKHNLALYAYCSPDGSEIYYIGKCDGTTVRGRWRYSAKHEVWDCITTHSPRHRLIVAEFETEQRMTRELVADIESLLIYHVDPPCNVQNTSSRGRYSRHMRIQCLGVWPLQQKIFKDNA